MLVGTAIVLALEIDQNPGMFNQDRTNIMSAQAGTLEYCQFCSMCISVIYISHLFSLRKCESIYIGWGLKYSSGPFNPALPPTVQEEFPAGADIAETTDPTVEQETALKAAQDEAQANMEEEEEPEESDED